MDPNALVSINLPVSFEEDPATAINTYHRAIRTLQNALEAELLKGKKASADAGKTQAKLKIPNRESIYVDMGQLSEAYYDHELTRLNASKYPPTRSDQTHQLVGRALRTKTTFIAQQPPDRLKHHISLTTDTRLLIIAAAVFTLVTLLIVVAVV